jgi:hypothetical protein
VQATLHFERLEASCDPGIPSSEASRDVCTHTTHVYINAMIGGRVVATGNWYPTTL